MWKIVGASKASVIYIYIDNNNNNHGSEATKGLGAMAYKAHNWPLKPMIFLKVIYMSVCMCEDNI